MKLLFLGLGSIGRRHVRLLREHFPQHEIFALRSCRNPLGHPGVIECYDWTEVEKIRPHIAFVCNPTAAHVPTAIECARRSMSLFIEKPLSHTLDGLDELVSLVIERKLTSYVAFPMRFIPQLTCLRGKSPSWARFVCRSYLPLWRPGRNHLETYSAHKNQGGGVLFDLSHEIDLARYLFGPIASITGVHGRRGIVTVDADDYAYLWLEHTGGTQTSIYLDTAWDGAQERYLEIPGEPHIDYQATDDIYLAQLKYFLTHLGQPMMNDIREASVLLRQIVRFAET